MVANNTNAVNLFIGLPLRYPRILIPVASPFIQSLSFNLYNTGSIQGKIFRQLGKAAAISGVLNMAGSFFGKPVESFHATETIKPILNNGVISGLKNDWAEALGKQKIKIALSLGTPNYYRKITALIFDERAKTLAFAKAGSSRQAGSLVTSEIKALTTFNELSLQSAKMPSLLGQGNTQNVFWLLQSPLLSGRPSPNALRKEHFTFLSDIANKTVRMNLLNESVIWKVLQSILENRCLLVKADFESERYFLEHLCEELKGLRESCIRKPWPFTSAHGDFAPWNMRLMDGKLALYDCECFMPLAPLGWDVIYFIFRVENLIKRKSLEKIWQALEANAYDEMISLFETKSGLSIPDKRILGMFVLLAVALDLPAKMASI